MYEGGEALGAAAFALLALAGLVVSGVFLANFVPQGTFGQLLSSGTVILLNIAVGIEVACAMVVLLARFFEEDITTDVTTPDSGDQQHREDT